MQPRDPHRSPPWPPSLWLDDPRVPRPHTRPVLDADTDADVVIVGAGLTGLWSAYHLAVGDPSLRIVVLDRVGVGFGASGRNGGWCSGLLPVGLDRLDRLHGRGTGRRMQLAMFEAAADVCRVAHDEGICADIARGGWVELARNRAQADRIEAAIREFRSHGFGEEDVRWLDRGEATAVVAATRVLGALFSPHCAAVQPALLTHGLAAAVERKGVRILEGADVVAIEPGRVRTSRHRVRAEVVLQATEAYGRDLPGQRRELVPVYSLMVATEPLTTAQWEAIGLHERATFNDARREVIYGQRTGDGRLAFGGRGAPYHLGSRIRPGFDVDARVRSRLVATLVDLFPSLADVTITHHWGGPLGIPRDWHPSVRYDPASGLGRAGGYVGDGVGATQLAGRTLADLVLRRDTDLVHLPWVDHHSPRWEPEPFRWLGVNGALRLARWIDRSEERRGRTPRWARVLDLLTGG